MSFQKAVRSKLKLRLGIFGPSGSGKTYGSLKIAKGLGGKIALCDSEQRSSVAFADITDFDVAPLERNTAEEYIEKITEAVKLGYDTLILDSISHEWMKTLESVEDITAASKSGNSYTAWKEPTKLHNRFVNTILQAPIHIICTMREKDQIEMIPNQNGKLEPVKIGFKPEQKKGIEYEFTTIFHLDHKHIATAEKDRTQLFDQFKDPLSESIGEELRAWLDQGVETSETRRASQERKSYVHVLLTKLNQNYNDKVVKDRCFEITKKESMSFWNEIDVEAVIDYLEEKIKTKFNSVIKPKPVEVKKQTA